VAGGIYFTVNGRSLSPGVRERKWVRSMTVRRELACQPPRVSSEIGSHPPQQHADKHHP
jgi:hypothetical protein